MHAENEQAPKLSPEGPEENEKTTSEHILAQGEAEINSNAGDAELSPPGDPPAVPTPDRPPDDPAAVPTPDTRPEEPVSLLAYAQEAVRLGFSVLPTAPGTKHPPLWEWKPYQTRQPTPAELEEWFSSPEQQGLGLVTGKVSGVIALDFDKHDLFARYHEVARYSGLGEILDRIKKGYHEETPNGDHLLYRCEDIAGSQKLAQTYLRNEDGSIKRNLKGKPLLKTLIETKGEGGFLVISPSHGNTHETGKPYVLVSGGLATIATITPEEEKLLLDLARSFDEIVKEEPKSERRAHAQYKAADGTRPGDLFNKKATWDEVLIPHGWVNIYTDSAGKGYWRRPGKDKGNSATTGYAGTNYFYPFTSSTEFDPNRAYSLFSAYAVLNHDGDFHKAAEALAREGYTTNGTGTGSGAGGGEDAASEADWIGDEPPDEYWTEERQDHASIHGDFNLTDLGNGERLASRHGGDLRYCNPWKKWLVWDGTRWQLDNSQLVKKYARLTVRSLYTEAKNLTDRIAAAKNEAKKKALLAKQGLLLGHAIKSEHGARVSEMLHLAQMDIPVLPEQLDRDLWLLNVANGTLDLRTGELRPHARGDLLTKCIPIVYDPTTSCPLWEAFLFSVMGGRKEVIGFLQRALGYSLTGDTREDCLFLLHGSGANGKSTLLSIIRALLADYGKQAAFSTFLHQDRETVRNDLADLQGARLVVASEVDEGRRLSLSVVKALTGQDPIKARFLFAEYFEYDPQMKIWLAANHKPIIRGTDHAIWRRIRLIPFTQKFEGKSKDPTMREKLLAELPGILAWAVRGCLTWQKEGLPTPETVQQATENYRAESDVIGAFIEECCLIEEKADVMTSSLYDSYTSWCKESGEDPRSKKFFGVLLQERGLEPGKGSGGIRIWKGLKLAPKDWH